MSAALHTGRPRRRSHAESLVRPDIVVDVDGPAYHAFHLGEIHAVAVEERAALLYPATLAHADVLAVIYVKRRQEGYTLVNLAPSDAR